MIVVGIFDIFKRRKKETSLENINVSEKSIKVQPELADIVLEGINNYSNIISNETIEEIKRINNLDYISTTMIRKMEKHLKLIDLLLKGNISEDILGLLNFSETLSYLPIKKEDLRFIKFFELDEKIKSLVALLNNEVDNISDGYMGCYLNLREELETVNYSNRICSFIPGVELNLGNELLTKLDVYSPFILYFPKTKYKIVYHSFEKFISGNIELNEDVIIQMSYHNFSYLDETIINKISKCKIIFSEKTLDIQENVQDEEEINYRLIKYNHLIYIIENSSLDSRIKEKLIYKIKNMYIDNMDCFDLDLSDEIIPHLSNLNVAELKKLTEEFELNIETYKKKEIQRPEFNPSFYIDENFPDFDKAFVESVINLINILPNELRIILLKEPRVSRKLGIPDNLSEYELKKISFMLSQRLSDTCIDFVNSLDFDVESFMSNPANNYYSSSDINPIVSKYGIFDYVYEDRFISVADILGHDATINCGGYEGKNILHTFDNFFQKNGDGYHTRALGLLRYTSGEQLLRELERRNHDTKDMKVKELEDGKYIISGNGLHRFSVLRFHYLLDSMKKEKSSEELYELYKIPVHLVSKTNLKKTYCNYLMQKANKNITYISFDNKKDEVIIYYGSSEQCQVMNEERLMYLMIQSIDNLDSYGLLEIVHFYNNCNSFKEFVDGYVPNLLDRIKIENAEVIQR